MEGKIKGEGRRMMTEQRIRSTGRDHHRQLDWFNMNMDLACQSIKLECHSPQQVASQAPHSPHTVKQQVASQAPHMRTFSSTVLPYTCSRSGNRSDVNLCSASG